MKTRYSLWLILFFVLGALNPLHAQKKRSKVEKIEISAKLIDQEKQPVSGARITVDEGVSQAISDQDGNFTIVGSRLSTLVIQTSRYKTKYIAQSEVAAESVIVLTGDDIYLGEHNMIEVPFRTQARRNIVGAVSVVDERELASTNRLNPLEVLAGKVAGLNVTIVPSSPGGSMTQIDVRGLSRGMKGNEPLVMIDGIERPLEDLLPEEIASISVLKDITSKMMYGPKAANGVLLVKTKRGEKFKRDRSISVEFGAQMPTRLPEYLNAHDYARKYNEGRINDGMQHYYNNTALAAYQNGLDPTLYPNIDFQKLALNNTGQYRKVTAQIRGGGAGTQYYVNGYYAGNGGYEALGKSNTSEKLGLRANLDIKISDWLKAIVDIAGNYEFYNTNYYAGNELFSRISTHRPNEYPLTVPNEEDPTMPFFGAGAMVNHDALYSNMYAEMKHGGLRENSIVKGQTNLGLDFNLNRYVKGVTAKGYLTFDTYNYVSIGKNNDFTSYRPVREVDDNGNWRLSGYERMTIEKRNTNNSRQKDNAYRNYGFFGELSYDNQFNKENELHADLVYFQSQREFPGFSQNDVNQTIALRTNYSNSKKWIAELDMAVMGSSKFAKGNRYGFFPSGGLAWVMTEEDFLQPTSTLNYLKLKATTGLIGTDRNIGYYLFENRWYNEYAPAKGNVADSVVAFGTNLSDNRVVRTFPINIGNPDLTWEKSWEINAGAELLMFNQHLSAEVNYFNNLRFDIITAVESYSHISGASAYMYKNFGKVRNQGVELDLCYKNQVGDFRYSIGGNLLWSKATYLKVDEAADLPFNRSMLAKSVDTQLGLLSDGLFKTEQEVLSATPQHFGSYDIGDARYKDFNKDGKIDMNDLVAVGNLYPRFQFGLNINLSYKGFDLMIAGSGKADYQIYRNTPYYWMGGEQKYSAFVNQYFNPATGTGQYPKLSTAGLNENNYRSSSVWMESGSFFKLRDVMLSYTLPTGMSNKLLLKKVSVFAKGSNLFTISSFKDIDPEYINAGVTGYPYFTTITGGINVVF